MKNLKVGAKIALSFASIVLCLVVIACVVVWANINTRNNAEAIQSDSKFQTMSSSTMLSFWNARFNARVIYSSSSDSSYAAAKAALEESNGYLKDMNDYITEHPALSEYSTLIKETQEGLAAWETAIDAVQNINTRMDSAKRELSNLADNIQGAADASYKNQQSLWRDESAQNISYDNKIRRADRLDGTISFFKDIEMVIINSEYLIHSSDTSEFNSLMTDINSCLFSLQKFIDSAQNQSTKNSAKLTIDAFIPYTKAVKAYRDMLAEREIDVNAAIAQGNVTLTELEALSHALDDLMEEAISDTISKASFSLIISISITAFSIVFAIIVALILVKAITTPINCMRESLVQMGSTGNLTLNPELLARTRREAQSKDEMGDCISAYMTFLDHLSVTGRDITRVADGDLTIDIATLSPQDTIGNAVTVLVDKLSSLLGEISNSTVQVSSSSKQIADGAQALAQGSTQQAAAVEQLSSSINAVALVTKENSAMATQAASLADTIKGNAEKGSTQMTSMIQAVREINDASQSISKVIKVIEDIAFQTNILALNAAVEAARAGQHGKGFAVVAEEVRSLAAKSADAAKDTGALIINSMEKAELGAKIAQDTSVSLSDIVAGINKSSTIVNEIALSSQQQTVSVDEINKGVDQVAQVIQQNSATSEESAASAEEMSNQSALLDELVSQFKTKASVAPLPGPQHKQLPMPTTPQSLFESNNYDKY